jgi:SAM-dependent methyltransferase
MTVSRSEVADVQGLPFADGSFDVVVANHMLYHAPDPEQAVRDLARVLRPDGRLLAATNGARHLRELGEIRAEVFGVMPLDDTVLAFGVESGQRILDGAFGVVEWQEYVDELRCTDPQDVLTFLLSVPPGEDATPEQRDQMVAAVAARFEQGNGVMTISKESGAFVCRHR